MTENITRPSCPAVQELAAFVDSAVADEERRRIVEHLASCERCYGIYAETLRLQEDDRAGGEVVEFSNRRSEALKRRLLWRWGAAAAAAVFVAMLVSPTSRDVLSGRGRLTADLPAGRLGAHLGPADGAPAFDNWSYARADDGFAAGLSKRERSVRLGARVVDLEVALRAADADRAMALLPELTSLAQSFEATEHIVFSYISLEADLEAGQSSKRLLELSGEAAGFLNDATEPDHLALGRWAEAARLAAASGDVRFLRQKNVRRFPKRVVDLELPSGAAQVLDAIEGRLEARIDSRDLPELQRAFSALLAQAGNP